MKKKLYITNKSFLEESAADFKHRIQTYDPIVYQYEIAPGRETEEDVIITMFINRETVTDFHRKISYVVDNWGMNPKQERKDTLLFLAIEFGLVDVVTLLLQKGFDPNRPCSMHSSLYICMVCHNYQNETIRKDILQILLQYNVSFYNLHTEKKNYDIRTLLIESEKEEYISFFEKLFPTMNTKQQREWKAIRLQQKLK